MEMSEDQSWKIWMASGAGDMQTRALRYYVATRDALIELGAGATYAGGDVGTYNERIEAEIKILLGVDK